MKTIDKTKILQKISNMKSVCPDARREIKELVEEIIGEKLHKEIRDFEVGDVFISKEDVTVCMIKANIKNRYVITGLDDSLLTLYSDPEKSKEEWLAYLNNCGYKKLGKVKIEVIKE